MSYFNFKNLLDFEKKSIFLINFLMILIVILFFLFNISLKYFFYFNIMITFFISYFYFKKSKKLSKKIIVTNLFIFFYFLYPKISNYFSEIFGSDNYIYIIFYNIIIAYLFLEFSDTKKKLIKNINKFNFKILLIVILLGTVFGFLFRLVKEPIPSIFTSNSIISGHYILFLIFSSFVVAFSEQMIFSGFLFNIYSSLTKKYDAYFQVGIIFVLFHLLRFEVLVKHYYTNFNEFYLIYITLYYCLLFIFMITSLYLYSFNSKKYKGNFIYAVILHCVTDLSLFLFTVIRL